MSASGTGPDNTRRWEARVSEAASRIETELRTLIRNFDDDVVPEIRKHGSAALRTLSSHLDRMAARMDDEDRRSATPPPPPPPSGRQP